MMEKLNAEEQQFVIRRRRLNAPLRRVIPLAAILLLCVWGYEVWNVPLLANPWHASTELKAGTVATTTLAVMAALTPLLFNATLLLTLLLLGFTLLWGRREQRYLALIERLQRAAQ